jgi:hypothetical protein
MLRRGIPLAKRVPPCRTARPCCSFMAPSRGRRSGPASSRLVRRPRLPGRRAGAEPRRGPAAAAARLRRRGAAGPRRSWARSRWRSAIRSAASSPSISPPRCGSPAPCSSPRRGRWGSARRSGISRPDRATCSSRSCSPRSAQARCIDVEAVRRALFTEETPADWIAEVAPRPAAESPAALLDGLTWDLPAWPFAWWTPTLAIRGDRDAFVPASDLWALRMAYGAETAVLPDTAHGLPIDPHWKSLAWRINAWLAERAIGASPAARRLA